MGGVDPNAHGAVNAAADASIMAEAAHNERMDRLMMMAMDRMSGGAGSSRAGLLSVFTGMSGKDTDDEWREFQQWLEHRKRRHNESHYGGAD